MGSRLRAASVMLGLAFRSDPRRALAVTLLTIAGAATTTLTGYWLKLLADGAIAGDGGRIGAAAGALAATAGLVGISAWTGFNLRTMLTEKTSLALDERVMELTASLHGLEQFERPDYLDRLNTLREEREHLARTVASLVQSVGLIVQVGLNAVLLATVHPLLLLLPVAGLPSLVTGAWAARLAQRALDATAGSERLSRHLFELATSAAPGKELRVFGLEDEIVDRFADRWASLGKTRTSAGLKGALVTSAGWLVFALGYVGAIAFVVNLAVDGRATVGEVLLTVTLASQVNRQVEGAAYMVNFLLKSLALAARLVWLMDFARLTGVTPATTDAPGGLIRGISFEDVAFRYPGTDRDVLHDVSITLPAGSTVALVGENGAGKTSFVKLLAGFYAPTSGRITVDGRDLVTFDPVAWRARLSAGFQDYTRYELVAREVVGVGDVVRVDDAVAVTGALERAHAADVVAALPDGLESQLGKSFEEGLDLSGGQWQKLALGRAFMRTQPLLLLLDEPTASLDAQTEHDLLTRYAEAARASGRDEGAITLLVSHRFSTVKAADLIVVFDEGTVVDTGSHAELMSRGGLYAKLYDLQAKSYR